MAATSLGPRSAPPGDSLPGAWATNGTRGQTRIPGDHEERPILSHRDVAGSIQGGELIDQVSQIVSVIHEIARRVAPEDLSFTRRMAEAGEMIGVKLLDHIILGSAGRWVSLGWRGAW